MHKILQTLEIEMIKHVKNYITKKLITENYLEILPLFQQRELSTFRTDLNLAPPQAHPTMLKPNSSCLSSSKLINNIILCQLF